MRWIVIEGPAGERRVRENTEYRLLPGERPVRSEITDHPLRACSNCGGRVIEEPG